MTDAKIVVFGSMSQIKGSVPLKQLREATSYLEEGHRFSPAFRKKIWDGRRHLMSRNGVFPTGLLSAVEDVLKEHEVPYTLEDNRVTPEGTGTFELEGVQFKYPYEYQLSAAQTAVEHKCGILKMATNAGKTEVACSITNYLRQPTLFCVGSRELLFQAQKRFMKRLGVGESEVGIVGDGVWSPGSWVTVATVGTLVSRKSTDECQKLLASVNVLFLDEAHHLGSETWYDVACLCTASYRFGLSGTPLDRTDGADLRLIATTGPVIVNVENKFLVERGISARAQIIWDKVTEPVLPKMTYAEAYKQGVVENKQLEAKVVEWTKVFYRAGLSTLVLVEQINHGKSLDTALWNCGDFIPHQFINGEEDTEVRSTALESFADRTLPVLIASTILDEGVDVPTIDALILAGSRKSRIKTMQRLGRGLRGKKLLVVEFANFCNDYLLKHSMERYDDYKEEQCFPIHQSGPDLQLVRKLWEET